MGESLPKTFRFRELPAGTEDVDLRAKQMQDQSSTSVHNPIGDGTVLHVEGDVSGQIAIGSNIHQESYRYELHATHGGIVNITSAPRIQARPTPIDLRPPEFHDWLDRHEPLKGAIAALQHEQPVEIYALPGVGKTTVISALAYDPQATVFPDGVIYLRGDRQSVEALLQDLYDAFYEADVPVKPSVTQIRHQLRSKKALILLDDLALSREEAEQVVQAVPQCAVLLASQTRCLWGSGYAMALPGLPLEDALKLVERELGRSLSKSERDMAQTLCERLNGHPLSIRQAIALIREKNQTFAAVLREIHVDAPQSSLIRHAIALLSQHQRWILALLGALGGIAILARQAAAITTLPNATPTLEGLQRLNLVQNQGDRYHLSGNLLEPLQQGADLTPWLERSLLYWIDQAEQLQFVPQQLMPDLDVLTYLLEWAAQSGHWVDVMRLGRLVDGALALSGRWTQWEQALQLCLQGSQLLGDRAAESWALHQWGTRALCLEDRVTAEASLRQALHLREALGDVAGAAVTRHNLALLLALPTSEQPATPPNPIVNRWGWKPGAIALSAVLLGGAAIWYFSQPETVTSALAFDPQSIEFEAPQAIGTRSDPLPVTLTNTSPDPLTLGTIRLTGANPEAFRMGGDRCSETTLPPSARCTLNVTFAPTSTGRLRADLIVPFESSAQSNQTRLTVQGIGTTEPVASFTLEPEQVNFGDQRVETASEPQTFTLTNTGDVPLELGELELQGSNPEDFGWVNQTCEAVTLPPEGNCFIEVTFTPQEVGDRTATLFIAHNAADLPNRWPLQGSGTAAPPVPAASILAFTANPPEVTVGRAVGLCYGVENAVRAEISPGIGEVTAVRENCISVQPDQTTRYTLSAVNREGRSLTQSVTVTVVPLPPEITLFEANPAEIDRNGTSRLCYGVQNASSVAISPGFSDLEASPRNCVSVNPAQTTTYTLTVTSPAGQTAEQQTTVTVLTDPPEITFFNADPVGDRVALCYGVMNAAQVSIEPGRGPVPVSLQHCEYVPFSQTTTFTLTATNPEGRSVSQNLRVVKPEPIPSPSLTAPF